MPESAASRPNVGLGGFSSSSSVPVPMSGAGASLRTVGKKRRRNETKTRSSRSLLMSTSLLVSGQVTMALDEDSAAHFQQQVRPSSTTALDAV